MSTSPLHAPSTLREVYDFIAHNDNPTKNEVVQGLGLSLPTVNKYVAQLLADGLISKGSKRAASAQGGRCPVGYGIAPSGRLAVGVDITAGRVQLVLSGMTRTILEHESVELPFAHTDEYYAAVAQAIESFIERCVEGPQGIERSALLGVGIAVPGLVDDATGRVFYGKVLGNEGMTVERISQHLSVPAVLVHDSDAAALAEFWRYTATANAFYLSLSGSVGGAALIDGHLYRGDGLYAGEIGHMKIQRDGQQCYCGQRGCMDPYCNSRVLAPASDLRDFFEVLDAGDPAAAEQWENYCTSLGMAVSSIAALFGSVVIVGGDVGSHLGPRIADVRQAVAQHSSLPLDVEQNVQACSYTQYPIATGAALTVVQSFIATL